VASSTIRYYESIGLLPEPEREHGQRRYHESVLGRLTFIGVAQAAGFKLDEIRALVEAVDDDRGIGAPMRALSTHKLDEIEALLERTKAAKGWLEVAAECGCRTPAECTLFPEDGIQSADAEVTLAVHRVNGRSCRRERA
jgi:MerR family redox-sensitive transcriptional activator SoxR